MPAARSVQKRRSAYQPTPVDRVVSSISAWIVAWMVLSWTKKLASLAIVALMIFVAAGASGNLAGSKLFSFFRGGDLPASARDRAPLFGEAWAEHDEAAMRRFVLPADAAKLRQWIAATPVEAKVADLNRAQRSVKAVSTEANDSDGVTVTVEFTCHPASGAAWEFAQTQMWTNSGGSWYFLPDLTSAAPVATPARRAAMPVAQVNNGDDNDDEPPARSPHSYRKATDPAPPPSSGSRNVIVPSSVPPWQRTR